MGLLEWTRDDQIQAEAFRVIRLRQYFPELLSPCFLHFSQQNTLNIHASTPEAIDDLTDNLEELAWYTWLCTGAMEVALWFCQEELLSLITQPDSLVEWKLLDSLQSAEDSLTKKDFSEMTAATLSPATKKGLIPANLIETQRPQLKKLATVADLIQLPVTEAEGVCDRQGIEIQLDEDGNPMIRLQDAAEMITSAALMKLTSPATSRPTSPAGTAERNGGTIVAEPPQVVEAATEIGGEAAEGEAKSKKRLENFKVSLSDPKNTALRALAAFAPTEKRQKQIARAIANQTVDGRKYLDELQAFYPSDRWDKAKEQLRNQFKKISAAPAAKEQPTKTAA